MKKVTVKQVREEAKHFCDKHPNKECYTSVNTNCWYGSKFDTLNLKMDLCDECMGVFYTYIIKTFGVEPVEDNNVERIRKL